MITICSCGDHGSHNNECGRIRRNLAQTDLLKSASGLELDTDFVFQQDNDHKCETKMMMKWLHDRGITVL